MSQRIEQASRDTAPAGSLRFNTDSLKLEIYNGEAWWNVDATSPDQQTGGTRMLIGGGKLTHPARQNVIQFVNLDTIGNAIDFGDLLNQTNENHVASSRTRGIFAGTYTPGSVSNLIEFVTIASTGDSVDFGGDLTLARRGGHSASSETRGIFAGGFDNSDRTNNIDFITIASTGINATDFGDLTLKGMNGGCALVSSPTRGVFGGGDTPGAKINNIQYITISTLGDAADFGDLNELRGSVAGGSNAVTGIYGGGVSPSYSKSMDKITIATTGNAVDYGDLLAVIASFGGGASRTRVAFAGGYSPSGPTKVNTIQYKEIASGGDTQDFGDLLQSIAVGAVVTNGHGGLG
jgi:hypothetical protein